MPRETPTWPAWMIAALIVVLATAPGPVWLAAVVLWAIGIWDALHA